VVWDDGTGPPKCQKGNDLDQDRTTCRTCPIPEMNRTEIEVLWEDPVPEKDIRATMAEGEQ